MAKPQSFCKIFFGDLLPNHIRIPSEFVKKHTKLVIRQISRLGTESGRYTWSVTVEQIDDDLCVTDGWSDFVTDNDIRFTDFLVFRLVGKSMLEVVVYRRNGCLKDPISPNSDAATTSKRRGRDVGGPSGTKGFSAIMSKQNYSYLHVPKAFAEETGIASKTEIILQDLQGKEWTVEIDSNRKELYNRISLCRGWSGVRKQNGLVNGTECWFEFDPSSGNLVLTNGPPQTSSPDKSTTMPSFFKILFNDDYDRTLRIPIAFSNEYGEMLSENSKLVAGSGQTWNVKIEIVDEQWCFTLGWDLFVRAFKLELGEYLVFSCDVDRSEFHVSVYGICACERKLPIGNLPMEDEDDDESTDEHPHFTLCLQKHQASALPIRKAFIEAAGLMSETTVVMQYPPSERYWPVLMDRFVVTSPESNEHCARFELRRGWSIFRRENRLVFGQTYLFKYIACKKLIKVKLVQRKKKLV